MVMKKLYKSLFVLCMAFPFVSCEKDLPVYDYEECGLMFEYQYARKKGFNVIPFIYNGSELLKNNDLEFNKEKLNAFKNEVMSLTPQYFASKDELVRKFTKALNAEIARNPQRGWIRL